MFVDQSKCIGCSMCIPYCPVQAISIIGTQAHIDYNACVECGNCRHSGVCPKGALVQQTLSMPRAIRQVFSNPRVKSPNTGIRGRGTNEMKTNDVTGRYTHELWGLSCEMGRPVLGTSMKDVEQVARLIAAHGGQFEEENPSAIVFKEDGSGSVKEEFLSERVLSFIIEAFVKPDDLIPLILDLKELQSGLETVFSVDLICKMEDGNIPAAALLDSAGIEYRPNGKTNIGLGRPLK